MPSLLDQPAYRRRYDDGTVAESIGRLPEQLADAAERFRPTVTGAMRASRALFVVGMGGSGLGADLVRGLVADAVDRSILSIRSPDLPAAVKPGTTVVLISYSGGTAETLAAATIARRRRVPLVVMTGGGRLAAFARQWSLPCYQIRVALNPSGQPRLGIGFTLGGLLVLLDALRWRRFPRSEQRAAQRAAQITWRHFQPDQPFARNPLKRLAGALAERFVIAVASDRYYGNAHILANQLNENAKTFAAPFALPELNHHLLEGLRFPSVVRRAAGLFLTGIGDESLRERFRLTEQVFRKQGLATFRLPVYGRNSVAQATSWLGTTSLLSYYLALLHRVSPSAIPWVDYFKRALGQRGT